MSRLLRKRIIDLTASGVDWSQGFLRIVRKRATDSSSLFTEGSSTKVRLYSAREAMKMIEATFSKQWILARETFSSLKKGGDNFYHFLLSLLWPPTSTRVK